MLPSTLQLLKKIPDKIFWNNFSVARLPQIRYRKDIICGDDKLLYTLICWVNVMHAVLLSLSDVVIGGHCMTVSRTQLNPHNFILQFAICTIWLSVICRDNDTWPIKSWTVIPASYKLYGFVVLTCIRFTDWTRGSGNIALYESGNTALLESGISVYIPSHSVLDSSPCPGAGFTKLTQTNISQNSSQDTKLHAYTIVKVQGCIMSLNGQEIWE